MKTTLKKCLILATTVVAMLSSTAYASDQIVGQFANYIDTNSPELVPVTITVDVSLYPPEQFVNESFLITVADEHGAIMHFEANLGNQYTQTKEMPVGQYTVLESGVEGDTKGLFALNVGQDFEVALNKPLEIKLYFSSYDTSTNTYRVGDGSSYGYITLDSPIALDFPITMELRTDLLDVIEFVIPKATQAIIDMGVYEVLSITDAQGQELFAESSKIAIVGGDTHTLTLRGNLDATIKNEIQANNDEDPDIENTPAPTAKPQLKASEIVPIVIALAVNVVVICPLLIFVFSQNKPR